MQVTCPGCESRFILPAGVREGVRLRCSVCRTEFPYETGKPAGAAVEAPAEPEAPLAFEGGASSDGLKINAAAPAVPAAGSGDLDLNPAPRENDLPEMGEPRRSRGIFSTIIALLLLAAVCAVGAFNLLPEFRAYALELEAKYAPGLITGLLEKPAAKTDRAAVTETVAEQKRPRGLVLRDVRQYYVKNEKEGSILVVDGVVVNQQNEVRRNVTVEAAIIGKDHRTIDSAIQRGGVRLSNLQLTVMSKAEILEAIADEREIAAVNSNVARGDEVPFTFVFFKPAGDVSEYAVKVGTSEIVPAAGRAAMPADAVKPADPHSNTTSVDIR